METHKMMLESGFILQIKSYLTSKELSYTFTHWIFFLFIYLQLLFFIFCSKLIGPHKPKARLCLPLFKRWMAVGWNEMLPLFKSFINKKDPSIGSVHSTFHPAWTRATSWRHSLVLRFPSDIIFFVFFQINTHWDVLFVPELDNKDARDNQICGYTSWQTRRVESLP